MKDFHVRPDCRLCSGSYTEVLDLGETALANEVWEDATAKQTAYPLCLVACDSCGHRQLRDVVNPELMYRNYSYVTGLSATYRAYLRAQARDIWDTWLDAGSKVVEIGGNDGTLGTYLPETVTYVNVDPSDVAQLPRSGGAIREREFFSLKYALSLREVWGKFDVIVANHVLAHTDHLNDIADGIVALLAENGRAIIEVGDGERQLAQRDGVQYIYAEHADIHDAHSFAAFWRRKGLVVQYLTRSTAQGCSMRLTLAHAGQADELAIEPAQWDNQALKRNVERLRSIGRQLRDLAGHGWTVTGYGASARMSTLAHVMGLTRQSMGIMYDDSPTKVGKLTPGLHIPIVPSSDLLNDQPDFCFNFCPWFEQEIKARHEGYEGLWLSAS